MAGLMPALGIFLIVLIAGWVALHAGRSGRPSSANREKYGPPPGMMRALDHRELGDRGWPSWDKAYEGSSASSISHMMLRSA
jgi:hypothetical protein